MDDEDLLSENGDKIEDFFDVKENKNLPETIRKGLEEAILIKKRTVNCDLQSEQQQLISQKQAIPILSEENVSEWGKTKLNNILDSQIIDFHNRDVALAAIHILTRPVKTSQEQNFLKKGIQGLSLFQSNKNLFQNNQMNHQIFKQIKLEYFKKNDIIFNIGSVYCLVRESQQDNATQESNDPTRTSFVGNIDNKKQNQNNNNTNNNNNLIKRKESQHNILPIKKLQVKQPKNKQNVQVQNTKTVMNEDLQSDDLNQMKKIFHNLVCAKIYNPGDAFGEISLMTNAASYLFQTKLLLIIIKRTATMICKEDTYLMTLNKEGFEKIIGAYHELIVRERLAFLQSYSFFAEIVPSKLLSILHYMTIETYQKNKVIYSEGDDVDSVYFIKSGEVQQFKRVSIEQNTQENDSQNPNQTKQINQFNIVKILKQQKDNIKKVPISIMGKNNVFGEEEVQQNISKRNNEVVVYSEDLTLFVIKKDKFLDNLRLNNTLDVFMKFSQNKNNFSRHRQSVVLAALDMEFQQKKLYQKQIDSERVLSRIRIRQDKMHSMKQSYMDVSLDEPSLEDGDFDEKQSNSEFGQSYSQFNNKNTQITDKFNQQKKNSYQIPQTPTNFKQSFIKASIESSPQTQRNSIYLSENFQVQVDQTNKEQYPQSPSIFSNHRTISRSNLLVTSKQANNKYQQIPDMKQNYQQDSRIRINLMDIEENNSNSNFLPISSPQSRRSNQVQARSLSPSIDKKRQNQQQIQNFSQYKAELINLAEQQPQNSPTQSSQMAQSMYENSMKQINANTNKPKLDQINVKKKRESHEFMIKYLEKQGLLNAYAEDWQNRCDFNQQLLKYLEKKNPQTQKDNNVFNIASQEMQKKSKNKHHIKSPFNIFSISDETIKLRATQQTINSKFNKNEPNSPQTYYHQNSQTSRQSNVKSPLSNTNRTEYSNNKSENLQPFKQSNNQSPSTKSNFTSIGKNEKIRNLSQDFNQKLSGIQLPQISDSHSSANGNSLETSNNSSFSQSSKFNKSDIVLESQPTTRRASLLFKISQDIHSKSNSSSNNHSQNPVFTKTPPQTSAYHPLKINLNKVLDVLKGSNNDIFSNFLDKLNRGSESGQNTINNQSKILPAQKQDDINKFLLADQQSSFYQSQTFRQIDQPNKKLVSEQAYPQTSRYSYFQQSAPYQKQNYLVNKLCVKKKQTSNPLKQNSSQERSINVKDNQFQYNTSNVSELQSQQQQQTQQYLIQQTNTPMLKVQSAFNSNHLSNNQSKKEESLSTNPQSQNINSINNNEKIQNESNQNSIISPNINNSVNVSKLEQKNNQSHSCMNIHYTIKKKQQDWFSSIIKSQEISRSVIGYDSLELNGKHDQNQPMEIYALQSNPIKISSLNKQANVK